MSYVLEALRRAEAERQRGQVPGVHAVTLDPAGGADGPSGRTRPRGPRGPVLAAAGLALAVVALVAAAGWWWSTPAQAPQAAHAPVVAVSPSSGPAPRPTPGDPTRAAVVGAGTPPPPVLTPPPPPVATPLPAAPPARPAAATVAPARAAAPGAAVPRLATLPESFRRELPAMAFGGATDSPEPSARMLIINGQLWREGDEVAPGLRLDRIALRSAQFSFRGQRFEADY